MSRQAEGAGSNRRQSQPLFASRPEHQEKNPKENGRRDSEEVRQVAGGKRQEIDGDRIGIAGASIGANLALRGGSRYEQVKSVVMLSPGLDYRGITTLDALTRYGQRAVMIVATERDTYSADSARTLNSQALGQHQLQIYPGSDHGTNIFQAQAGLQPMMLAWFKTTL